MNPKERIIHRVTGSREAEYRPENGEQSSRVFLIDVSPNVIYNSGHIEETTQAAPI